MWNFKTLGVSLGWDVHGMHAGMIALYIFFVTWMFY